MAAWGEELVALQYPEKQDKTNQHYPILGLSNEKNPDYELAKYLVLEKACFSLEHNVEEEGYQNDQMSEHEK